MSWPPEIPQSASSADRIISEKLDEDPRDVRILLGSGASSEVGGAASSQGNEEALQVRWMDMALKMSRAAMPVAPKEPSRAAARGRLLRLFERAKVPTGIIVGRNSLRTNCLPWEQFWQPVLELTSTDITDDLGALYSAWLDYIRSGFDAGLVRHYCYAYFVLLEELIALFRCQPSDSLLQAAVHTALGFECVGVCGRQLESPAGAATSTLRNPCYLLAKLRHPGALDDPQFLPLLTVSPGPVDGLFYHYRRHKLSTDSDQSVVLYLRPGHPDSFPTIDALEARMSTGSDPRADERAARIANGVVIPYLRGQTDAAIGEHPSIEFVDVGSGSGVLVAKLCQLIKRSFRSPDCRPKFRAYMLDLLANEPSRFFRTPKVRGDVDTLAHVSGDYRKWFDRPGRLPNPLGPRVAILSRFFNNLSTFGITRLSPRAFGESADLGDPSSWWPACSPSRCLAPDGPGPQALIVSNRRLWLTEGRTFVQASLSDFLAGLQLLGNSVKTNSSITCHGEVFLPLRSFQPKCLLTRADKSLLGELLLDCSLVVINDADLRPRDLVAHFRKKPIPGSTAVDMTEPLGLKGHFMYAIGRVGNSAVSSLNGTRLW